MRTNKRGRTVLSLLSSAGRRRLLANTERTKKILSGFVPRVKRGIPA